MRRPGRRPIGLVLCAINGPLPTPRSPGNYLPSLLYQCCHLPVGCLLHTTMFNRRHSGFQYLSSRLLTASVSHFRGLGGLTVVVAYAQTNDGEITSKDDSYWSMIHCLHNISPAGIIVRLGDCNAATASSAMDGLGRVIMDPSGIPK